MDEIKRIKHTVVPGLGAAILKALLAGIIIIFCNTALTADTYILKEGSLIIGKTLSKSSRLYVVKNSYGTFRIKKRYILKMYLTDDYRDDIAIQKKLGKTVDEEAVKRDFLAGMRKDSDEREVEETAEDDEPEEASSGEWNSGRFMVSGIFLSIKGQLHAALPYGYGFLGTYDQGVDSIIGKRRFWMPGLRLEGGYLYYEKNDYMIKGSTWSAGLLWIVPIYNNRFGSFTFSGTAGMSSLTYEKEPLRESSNTLSAWGTAGYEYPVGRVLLQVQGRYMFIFDKDMNIHSLGGVMGVGMRLW